MPPKFIKLTQAEINAMTEEEVQNKMAEMDVLLKTKLEEQDEIDQQRPASSTRNSKHTEQFFHLNMPGRSSKQKKNRISVTEQSKE